MCLFCEGITIEDTMILPRRIVAPVPVQISERITLTCRAVCFFRLLRNILKEATKKKRNLKRKENYDKRI